MDNDTAHDHNKIVRICKFSGFFQVVGMAFVKRIVFSYYAGDSAHMIFRFPSGDCCIGPFRSASF